MLSRELAEKLYKSGYEAGCASCCEDATLEELIEACGGGYFKLEHKNLGIGTIKAWEAQAPHLKVRRLMVSEGDTSEEAVVNLYIALHPYEEKDTSTKTE